MTLPGSLNFKLPESLLPEGASFSHAHRTVLALQNDSRSQKNASIWAAVQVESADGIDRF